jgi:7-cyano-7-deazaguanine synthase
VQDKRCVVLVSGGLDSATTLAVARTQHDQCYALTIDYGQRHRAELAAAARVAAAAGVVAHRTIHIDLDQYGGSALTDRSIPIPEEAGAGIPVTYVPARNTVFLALALGWAEVLRIGDIYIGVNAVDYSGYPDCRPEFIAAFENLARKATKAGVEQALRFRINAPLIALNKADIIRTGIGLGVDYAATVSCYQADDSGLACGRCDSCRLRHAGFIAADVPDPTRYQPGAPC